MYDNEPSPTEEEKTAKTDAAATGETPPEVFDSSTYDSMTDLKTSASMEESEVNKVLSDTEGKEPIPLYILSLQQRTQTFLLR